MSKMRSLLAVLARGAAHHYRIDAVAGAAAHFKRAMMMDVDQAAKAMRDTEFELPAF
jgi:phage-related minor tail protein